MTATQTSTGRGAGGSSPRPVEHHDWPTSAYDPEFDRLVMAAPIVDNANDRLWGPNGQYDGPRCDYCGDTQTVDDGDRLSPACIGAGAA